MSQPRPVIDIPSGGDTPEIEREPLFSLDGVTYDIPKVIPPNQFMTYLQDLRNGDSPEQAQAKLLNRLIGRRAVDALAACTTLRPQDLKALLKVVAEKAADAQEEYGGN